MGALFNLPSDMILKLGFVDASVAEGVINATNDPLNIVSSRTRPGPTTIVRAAVGINIAGRAPDAARWEIATDAAARLLDPGESRY